MEYEERSKNYPRNPLISEAQILGNIRNFLSPALNVFLLQKLHLEQYTSTAAVLTSQCIFTGFLKLHLHDGEGHCIHFYCLPYTINMAQH